MSDESNYWYENRDRLQHAYCTYEQTKICQLRFDLIHRALYLELGSFPIRILDVGGGGGGMAIRMAMDGHAVVMCEPDPKMLSLAKRNLEKVSPKPKGQLDFVEGELETARELEDQKFDLVCCHGVLLYLPDVVPFVRNLCEKMTANGLLSIVSANPGYCGMASVRKEKWREAIASIITQCEEGDDAFSWNHDIGMLTEALIVNGAHMANRYGVMTFVESLSEDTDSQTYEDIFELEWLGGLKEPYRSVSRHYHLLARKQ